MPILLARQQGAGAGPVPQLGRDHHAAGIQRLVLQAQLDDRGYRAVAEAGRRAAHVAPGELLGDEGGGGLAPGEAVLLQAGHQEVAVVARTEQHGFLQGLDEAQPGDVAGGAAGDNLGHHRVVKRRDLLAADDAVVHPDAGSGWR